jgi:hypothetical protein
VAATRLVESPVHFGRGKTTFDPFGFAVLRQNSKEARAEGHKSVGHAFISIKNREIWP